MEVKNKIEALEAIRKQQALKALKIVESYIITLKSKHVSSDPTIKTIALNEEQVELLKSVLEEKYNHYFRTLMLRQAHDCKEVLDLLEY